MYKNYLKSALRFWKQNKAFVFINALSMSIALTVSFIIMIYVINEFSYDRCHANFKRIYRVLNYYDYYKKAFTGTPYALASELKNEYPQIEKSISVLSVPNFSIKVQDEYSYVSDAIYSDSEVFDIYTLPLARQTQQNDLLDDKNSIVLSKGLAEKLFPDQDPLGKVITCRLDNEDHFLIIKGIFRDVPPNSTFKAQCILSSKLGFEIINKAYSITDADNNWSINSWTTWILLSKKSNPENLEKSFHSLELKYLGQDSQYHYLLQNLSDVYLGSENIGNAGLIGNIKNIRLLIIIAIMIFLVATMNYIILSTSVSSERYKEIGIRKSFGASNSDLKYQLYSESVFLSIFVLPIALLITWMALPMAGKLYQTSIQIIYSNLFIYISVFLVLTLIIGIASGTYTSTVLSRLEAINVLKNSIQIGKKKTLTRSVLIVFQILIFCSFVSSVFIIRSQYQYALKRDPTHYNSDILIINIGRDFTGYSALLNNIKANPNVILASGARECLPMKNSAVGTFPNYQDNEIRVQVESMPVDFDFLETMGLELVEGRSFSREFGSDLTQSVILNETAVKKLSIINPVSQKFGSRPIIGVVKDFNLHSIHSDIPATAIYITDKYITQIAVHYRSGSLRSTLSSIDSEWRKLAPNKPLNYITIEDLTKSLYSTEKNLTISVAIYAFLTVLIAASGLLGLTLFLIRTRTKEIGIKKVFGCSEWKIIYTFLLSNLILVLFASLSSIPITLYFMAKWLSNYAYKINISWWFFVIAFCIASLIVLLTVFIYSYKASRINPVKALRYE
jgi:putative ABC transport system permease protein